MPFPRSLGNAGIALATVVFFPISRMTSPAAMPVSVMSLGSMRARPRPTSLGRASVAFRIRSPATASFTASRCVITASLPHAVCSIETFAFLHRDIGQVSQLESQGEILVLQTKMILELLHALLQPQQCKCQALDLVVRQVPAVDAMDGLTLDQLTQRLDQRENQPDEVIGCGFIVGGKTVRRWARHDDASGGRTVTNE